MKCKLCDKLIKKGTKHCPACARAVKAVRKIPKKQRGNIKRLLKSGRVSMRRLLA